MHKKTMKTFTILVFALLVFNVGLSWANDSAVFNKKVKEVSVLLDEVRDLKANNDASWKPKVYEAYGRLKPLLRQDKNSGEVYLLFARCYWYNDRLDKADKSIRKAKYYEPHNIDVFIFAGDMYSGEITKNQSLDEGEYDPYDELKKASRAYESALKIEGIDADTKGLVYVKLGDLYHSVSQKRRAKKAWNKAIEAAPGSDAAKEAEARLKDNK